MIWTILRRHPFEAATAAAIIILLIACGWLWVDAGRAEAEAIQERARAAEWKASHDSLRAATDAQADAVRRLVTESAQRSERAMAALQEAARAASRFQQDARDILASRPPAGVDPCVAAREAFAAELAKERR